MKLLQAIFRRYEPEEDPEDVTREDVERERRQCEREIELLHERMEYQAKEITAQHKRKVEVAKQDYEKALKKIEDAKLMAEAWRPFPHERKLTKGEQSALMNITDTLYDTIEIGAKELVRQCTNKAMIADGEERNKPMWCAVGINMLLSWISETSKQADKRHEREKVREENERKMKPPPQDRQKRDVSYLYDNPKV